MKRAISLFLLSFSILAFSAGASYAVGQTESAGVNATGSQQLGANQSLIDERQRKVDEIEQKRKAVCDNTTKRVADAQQKLLQSKNKYQTRYQIMTQNLQRLSLKLSEAGIDTTELDAKVSEFVTMQNEFTNQYQNSYENLAYLVNPACDGDLEMFKERKSLALAHTEQFKAQVKAMNQFMKEDIKELLLELKLQYENSLNDSDEATDLAE